MSTNNKEKENQEKFLEEYVNQQEGVKSESIGPPVINVPSTKIPWERDQRELSLGNQLGWIPLSIKDLPTQGLFYPEQTAIAIRSANGAEIRHWSTLNDDPNTNPNYLSDMDDMLNYVIERCVTIKSVNPELGMHLSWKDIKEVDRFYLLLAIHELTFPSGENKLQINVSDTLKIDVKKDMVSYISLDPNLMKHYDEVERCFVFRLKTGKIIKLDIPSIGITQWLKGYISRKQSMQQSFDMDYLNFAPFIVRNWRGLNDQTYNKFVEESLSWDVTAISLLTYVKKLFADTIDPVIRFTDEGGMERIAPLNFQGGIKSLFLISDPFGQLE